MQEQRKQRVKQATALRNISKHNTSTASEHATHPGRHTGADGLRVLALLGVMSFHLRPDLVPGGFLGVLIFFVLAGYYTTRGFVQKPRLELLSFYQNKFLRLWPPLIFLLASLALITGFLLPEVFLRIREGALAALGGYSNWAEIWAERSYFNRHGRFDPLTHLWALSLEMQFYLVYPLIYGTLSWLGSKLPAKSRLYGRELAALFLFALATLSAGYMFLTYNPSADPTPVYYGSLTRAFAFLVGAAFNLHLAGRQMRLRRQGRKSDALRPCFRNLCALTLLAIMVGLYFCSSFQSDFLFRGGMFAYSILAALFIRVAGVKPVASLAIFNSKIVSYLAQRSYGLYLWQFSLQVLVEAWLRFSTVAFWPRLLIQLALLLLFSELSWRLFEQRGSVRPAFRLSLNASLALILSIMLILPPPVVPQAPALAGAAVESQIAANRQRLTALRQRDQLLARQSSSSDAASAAPGSEQEGTANTAQPTPIATTAADSAATSWANTAGNGLTAPSAGSSSNASGKEDQTSGESSTAPDATLEPAAVATTYAELSGNPFGFSAEQVSKLAAAKVVMVGDSVLAMALADLQRYMPQVYIDAEVSRHFFQGVEVLSNLEANGVKGDLIVVALATNGDLQIADAERYLSFADSRPLIFVNTVVPGTWEQTNNDKLQQFVNANSNCYLVDWYSAAKEHPEFFYQDATHPVPLGAQYYDLEILKVLLRLL